MVKKNTVKKNVTSFHFSSLNNEKRFMSIVGIALLIGVVASIIPGDPTITGNAPAFDGIFSLLGDVLGGVNDLIVKAFAQFFGAEDIKTTYLRLILFSAIAGIGYFIMRQFNEDSPFTRRF